MKIEYDTGFHEVADGVWMARYAWHDVNVTLVEGGDGVLLVDTHSSAEAARAVLADVRRLGRGDVLAIVNTHEHFDHVFGNATAKAVCGENIPIYATRRAAERTPVSAELFKDRYRREHAADPTKDPRTSEILGTPVLPADHLFDDRMTVDIGGRRVELVHPGRGHTAGDLVVWVPDANVMQFGDLLEATGPPVYIDDCYPLEWASALDSALALLDARSVVLAGHGQPADLTWARGQQLEIASAADSIRRLVDEGAPMALAREAASWPWPLDWRFSGALQAGYAQLGVRASSAGGRS